MTLPRALPALPSHLHGILTTRGDICPPSALLNTALEDVFDEWLAAIDAVLEFRRDHNLSYAELRQVCRAEARRIAEREPKKGVPTSVPDFTELTPREVAIQRGYIREEPTAA